MSETPERKVLKEVLANLKSKSLTSNEIRKKRVALTIKELSAAAGKVFESIKKKPDSPIILLLMSALQRIELLVEQLTSSSNNTIGDMEIYIDALERYSINLDDTLAKIFGHARKMAEVEIKKQEELRKREPSGMTV